MRTLVKLSVGTVARSDPGNVASFQRHRQTPTWISLESQYRRREAIPFETSSGRARVAENEFLKIFAFTY
jgi:hypothetical protein